MRTCHAWCIPHHMSILNVLFHTKLMSLGVAYHTLNINHHRKYIHHALSIESIYEITTNLLRQQFKQVYWANFYEIILKWRGCKWVIYGNWHIWYKLMSWWGLMEWNQRGYHGLPTIHCFQWDILCRLSYGS